MTIHTPDLDLIDEITPAVKSDANGTLTWTLAGQSFSTTATLLWREESKDWTFKGSVGQSASPGYQLIVIKIKADSREQVILGKFERNDPRLNYFHAHNAMGGIYFQSPGSVQLYIDWNDGKLGATFDGEIRNPVDQTCAAIDGTFAFSPA